MGAMEKLSFLLLSMAVLWIALTLATPSAAEQGETDLMMGLKTLNRGLRSADAKRKGGKKKKKQKKEQGEKTWTKGKGQKAWKQKKQEEQKSWKRKEQEGKEGKEGQWQREKKKHQEE